MLPSRSLPGLSLVLLLSLCAETRAQAQVEAPTPLEEVDPDAPRPGASPAPDELPEPEPLTAAPSQQGAAAPSPAPAAAAARPSAAAAQPQRAAVPAVLAPRVEDAQLVTAWRRVQQAQDPADLESALRALSELRADVGATDLEPFAVALSRLAEARRRAADEPGALQLAEAAAALAPGLPSVQLALAKARLLAAPADVGGYVGHAAGALRALREDPRHLRAALANAGSAALLSLVATASLVVLLLFARAARTFLHDVHHLFPRVTARWQSAALALLLLGLPALLRLGWAALLLALFAAAVLYLTPRERALGAALLALLGVLPLAAGQLAQATAFAGTVAEDVYLLERGGLAAAGAGARVRARDEAQRTSFAELFALGRYEARRGNLEVAAALYKRAAALRSAEPRLLTNLGNVRLALGDAEGAVRLYHDAARVDASLAEPQYNLAQVHRRRAGVLVDAAAAEELGRASAALTAAQRLQPELLERPESPAGPVLMNRLLLSPALPGAELYALPAPEAGAPVQAQLERLLLGGFSGPAAWAVPGLLAGLLLLLALSRDALRASRGCARCGRSVCRRCDRELPVRSALCGQCVNAFVRRGLVAPRVRALKQAEISRHRAWLQRLSLGVGALLGGAGHLLSGLPLRGALHAFVFLFLLLGALGGEGLVRAPYAEPGTAPLLAALLLVLLPLHLLSLRSLRRHQARTEPEAS